MKILWLGPLSDRTKKRNSTLSPAADYWQRGLIRGLQANGVEVEVFSFQPNPLFPKGQLKFYDNKSEDHVYQVGYFNFPGIREKSLIRSFKKKLNRESQYDAVITYNCLDHHVALGRWFSAHGVPWISIIADDEYKPGADLYVFLSYGYYQQAQVEPKMHLDGGVDEFVNSQIKISEKKILHFSGSLNKWTGIFEFAESFSDLSLSNVELHIYGNGDSVPLERISEKDPRIKVKGFVSKEDLRLARKEAFAFVNPRPIDIKSGEYNFPSKILEYLRFGKPILSTKTKGLAPYYDKLICYYDPKDLDNLHTTLRRLLNMELNQIETLNMEIKKFAAIHTFEIHAEKLVKRIASL